MSIGKSSIPLQLTGTNIWKFSTRNIVDLWIENRRPKILRVEDFPDESGWKLESELTHFEETPHSTKLKELHKHVAIFVLKRKSTEMREVNSEATEVCRTKARFIRCTLGSVYNTLARGLSTYSESRLCGSWVFLHCDLGKIMHNIDFRSLWF